MVVFGGALGIFLLAVGMYIFARSAFRRRDKKFAQYYNEDEEMRAQLLKNEANLAKYKEAVQQKRNGPRSS